MEEVRSLTVNQVNMFIEGLNKILGDPKDKPVYDERFDVESEVGRANMQELNRLLGK